MLMGSVLPASYEAKLLVMSGTKLYRKGLKICLE